MSAQISPHEREKTVWRVHALRVARTSCSVPVSVWLERPVHSDPDVIGLLLRGNCHFGTQRWEMQGGHLLVEILRKEIDIVLVALLLGLQKVELRQHLVGEGAGHDEGRMASGAAQVQEAP